MILDCCDFSLEYLHAGCQKMCDIAKQVKRVNPSTTILSPLLCGEERVAVHKEWAPRGMGIAIPCKSYVSPDIGAVISMTAKNLGLV